jgi:hypothetical protein
MKKTIIPLLALALISLASCEKDPPPLNLERFVVLLYDDDNSGTQTVDDALGFDIAVLTTDSDQHLTEWDFSYFVNDNFAGLLQGDENIHLNSLLFDADVYIGNLALPGPGSLGEGDVVEFRLWCRDNFGTELEHTYRFVLEE